MTDELESFYSYLMKQQLGTATMSLYYGAVRRALEGIPAGRPLEAVLTDESLGASRRETYRKALFHWAAFKQDERLAARLRAWTPGRRPQRAKGPAEALEVTAEWPALRRAVLCHSDPHLAAVLYLICTSGLRIAEVLDLTSEKLQAALDEGETRIMQKGLKLRSFSLPTRTMREQAQTLAANLSETQTVEKLLRSETRTTRKGVEAYVRRELESAARAAGVQTRVTPHVLRRTVGDAVYETSDHDMRAVAEVLGHDPGSRTTQRWYQDHVRRKAGAAALSAALGGDDDEA